MLAVSKGTVDKRRKPRCRGYSICQRFMTLLAHGDPAHPSHRRSAACRRALCESKRAKSSAVRKLT